eukprot:scaffold214_cov249-Pinguiococcus_pyrenoidosus.AAC.40
MLQANDRWEHEDARFSSHSYFSHRSRWHCRCFPARSTILLCANTSIDRSPTSPAHLQAPLSV